MYKTKIFPFNNGTQWYFTVFSANPSLEDFREEYASLVQKVEAFYPEDPGSAGQVEMILNHKFE